MGNKFAEITFTPTVQKIQLKEGSRSSYANMESGEDYNHRLHQREIEFISTRDSLYMASVTETCWPYIQHRGGPAGFVKLIDDQTIAFADYSGNRQYISTGNFRSNDRIALFFMDYPNRQRLKMLGRVKIIDRQDSKTLELLEDKDYPAKVERGFFISIEAFDWNCPQFITPRFSEAEVTKKISQLQQENLLLKKNLNQSSRSQREEVDSSIDNILSEGNLQLIVSGIRQLTSRVRAYELRHPQGYDLPKVEPGSHIRIPVQLDNDHLVERYYSIVSNPERRDIYEIAVLREEEGRGGSKAIHENYQLGTRIRIPFAENHFPLHQDMRPAILIAGGIGITAIKPMAQVLSKRGNVFELHYTARSKKEMAFRDRMAREFGVRLHLYSSQENNRLNIMTTLKLISADALIYVCGPKRLISAVNNTCNQLGISRERIQLESFS